MSVAHVQTKDAQTASGTTTNVSLTGVASGNHLTAGSFVWHSPNPTVTAATSSPAATWSNTGLGTLSFADTSGDTMRVDVSENVASGAWTVTIHTSTSGSAVTGIVVETSGAATSSSVGNVNHTSGSSNTATQTAGSITPTAGSGLITFIMSGSANTAAMANPTASNNTPATVRSDATAWNGSNSVRAGAATFDNAAASATNYTWSESSGTNVLSAAIIEILAGAGGGGATVEAPLLMMMGIGG